MKSVIILVVVLCLNSVDAHRRCTCKIERRKARSCYYYSEHPCFRNLKVDGVYTIYPDGKTAKRVYCDMTTDGGGWTVIQRRSNMRTSFVKTWNEYKEGFGDPHNDYWIGNDAIYSLTCQKDQMLRIDMELSYIWQWKKVFAKYSQFYIDNERHKYKLTVGKYSGTAGDRLTKHHNGMNFSTYDRDNDNSPKTNCAKQWKSYNGWWYNLCFDSNLNGKYYGQGFHPDGIVWNIHKYKNQVMSSTTMMIKPRGQ